MTYVQQLVKASPTQLPVDEKQLIETIDLLYDGAATCTACADACSAENEPHCAVTCINCADVCFTTAKVLSRASGFDAELLRQLLSTCEYVCRTCAEMCEMHADGSEHCRVCADSCRRRAEACSGLLEALQAA